MSKEQQAVELEQASLPQTLASVAKLDSYFTSGNEILPDRAWVPISVWNAVKLDIDAHAGEITRLQGLMQIALESWDRTLGEQLEVAAGPAVALVASEDYDALREKVWVGKSIPVDDGENMVTLDKRDLFDFVRGMVKNVLLEKVEGLREADAWSEAHDLTEKCLSQLYDNPVEQGEDELITRALLAAKYFIINGTALGYIRMPETKYPDPAHDTLPLIESALRVKLATQHGVNAGSVNSETPDQCVKRNWQQFNKLTLSPSHPLLDDVRGVMAKHGLLGFQNFALAEDIVTAVQQHLVSKARTEAVLIDWERETNNPLAEFEAICVVYDSAGGTFPGPKMSALMDKVEIMLTGWFSWHREHLRSALVDTRIAELGRLIRGIQLVWESLHSDYWDNLSIARAELDYKGYLDEYYVLIAEQVIGVGDE